MGYYWDRNRNQWVNDGLTEQARIERDITKMNPDAEALYRANPDEFWKKYRYTREQGQEDTIVPMGQGNNFIKDFAPRAALTLGGAALGGNLIAAAGAASGGAGTGLLPGVTPGATGLATGSALPGTAATTASGGGISGWLSKIADKKWMPNAVSAVGDYLNVRSQNKQRDEDREFQSRSMMANYLADTQARNSQEDITRAQSSLQATQMDPYAQAKDRNAANIRGSVRLKSNGAIDIDALDRSALSSANLDAQKEYFYKNVADMNPNVPLNDVSPQADEFRMKRLAELQAEKQRIEQEIQRYLTGRTT